MIFHNICKFNVVGVLDDGYELGEDGMVAELGNVGEVGVVGGDRWR